MTTEMTTPSTGKGGRNLMKVTKQYLQKCHITGKINRSGYCLQLRNYLGYEGCPRVCERLPYGLNHYFQERGVHQGWTGTLCPAIP